MISKIKTNISALLIFLTAAFFTDTFSECSTPAPLKHSRTKPDHSSSSDNSGNPSLTNTENGSPADADINFSLDTTVLGPFYFPINGKVISHFGRRGGRMHTGTDIKLSHGDTVRAAFSGVVTKASTYYGYGILVVLKHPDNLETYYAHLSKALVDVGENIVYGTPVGLGGRTGRATTDHLHFEIRTGGRAMNAENFFDFNGLVVKNLRYEKRQDTSQENTVTPVSSKKYVKSSEGGNKYHTIKKGDTLYSISKRYGTTVEEICKLNRLKKNSVLSLGMKVRVK